TDDNLNRVLDILHELDDRMEPLQIQSSLASDYLMMSAELKDIEIAVIAHDLRIFVEENLQLEAKLEELTQIKLTLNAQIDELENNIQQHRKAMSEID